MTILFITRSYSNEKGGKEIYNYNLVKALNTSNKENKIRLISNSGSILNLLWFYPYSFIKGFFSCLTNKIDYIHSGDTFMLPVAITLSAIFNKKVSLTVYGLDITYKSKLYQSIFIPLARKSDKIIAISEATKQECLKKGIKEEKIVVIPCGVNSNELKLNESKTTLINNLEKKFNIPVKGKKVIITVGRLVKRKGVQWFIENAIPKLDKSYIYLIAGEGEEKENIQNSIVSNKLESRVFMLGRIDQETLKELYNASDVFVMPNIQVEGDIEGFGIVAIEAASTGLPVVASNIEGIKDAIINNKTGFLIKEKDTNGFISSIEKSSKLNKKTMSNFISKGFSWSLISQRYLREVWR